MQGLGDLVCVCTVCVEGKSDINAFLPFFWSV